MAKNGASPKPQSIYETKIWMSLVGVNKIML